MKPYRDVQALPNAKNVISINLMRLRLRIRKVAPDYVSPPVSRSKSACAALLFVRARVDFAGGRVVFLTKEEMRILTGTSLRAKQIEVLSENRIPFFLNFRKWPVVARSAIEGRSEKMQNVAPEWRPAVMA